MKNDLAIVSSAGMRKLQREARLGRELAQEVIRLQRFIPVAGVDATQVGRDWCERIIPVLGHARKVLEKS